MSIALDESVLLRDFGGQKLMYDQLQRLIEVGRLPNVNLQIRPLAAAQPPPGVDSFELLRFGPTYHDVVFADMLSRGIYFEEDLDTYHFSLTFDRLRSEALDPAESEKLIARIADQNWQ